MFVAYMSRMIKDTHQLLLESSSYLGRWGPGAGKRKKERGSMEGRKKDQKRLDKNR